MNSISAENRSGEIVSTVEIQPDRRRMTVAERVAALAPTRRARINELRARVEEAEAKLRAVNAEEKDDGELLLYAAAMPKCKALPAEDAAALVAMTRTPLLVRRGLYYAQHDRYRHGRGMNGVGRAARAIVTGDVPVSVIRRAAVHAILAHNEDCDASGCRVERWDEYDGPIQLLEVPAETLVTARVIAANARPTPERTLLRALLSKAGSQ